MSVAYKRKAPVQLTPSNIEEFNQSTEETPGQFQRADPETLKTRKLVRVPKQTNDNFFDDDSDICLDDDFAEAPKNTSSFSNTPIQSISKSGTTDQPGTSSEIPKKSEMAEDSVKTDSSAPKFPSFGVKPSFGTKVDEQMPSTITNNSKAEEPKKELSNSGSSFPSFTQSTGNTPFGLSKKSSFGNTSFGSFSATKTEKEESDTKEKQAFGGNQFQQSDKKSPFSAFPKPFGKSISKDTETEEKTEEPKKSGSGFGFSSFASASETKDDAPKKSGFAGFGANAKKTENGFGGGNPNFPKTGGFAAFGKKDSTEETSETPKTGFSSFSAVPFEGTKKEQTTTSTKTFGSFGGNTSFTGFGGVKTTTPAFTKTEITSFPTEDKPLGAETAVPTIEKPKEEIPTGEEEESTVVEEYSKLYKFIDGKFEPIAQGILKLNKFNGEDRFRLILRSEGGLKLMLNALLFKGMEAKKREAQIISISAINFSDPEPRELSTFLIRFRTADEANRLFEKLEDSLKTLD